MPPIEVGGGINNCAAQEALGVDVTSDQGMDCSTSTPRGSDEIRLMGATRIS